MIKYYFTTIAIFFLGVSNSLFAGDSYGCGQVNLQQCCDEPCKVAPVIIGIILVDSCDKVVPLESARKIEGVCTDNVVLPGDRYCLEGRLYEKVCNQFFCPEWLEQAKCEIMNYYKECNRPFVVVEVPEQDITDGVIQLVIREGRVGKITCVGNQYYPKEYFADLLGLSEGNFILYDTVSKSMGWLGMHPFHRAELVFKPGANPCEVDVEIIAQDRRPWKVYGGVDNQGTKTTGYGRAFAGVLFDDVLRSGGILGYEYRTSYDFKKFQSHIAGYTVPLHCGHIFNLAGMFSNIKPDIDFFHSTGYFAGVTAQYSIPVAKWNLNKWIDNITVGLEWKRLNNNLLFLDDPATPILDGGVNITAIRVYFDKGQHFANHSMIFNAALIVSPGDIIAEQSNHDYNELQRGAKSTFAYATYGLEEVIYLPYDLSLVIKNRAQIATGTLLPCEQYILGGENSIRGYDTAEYICDNGMILNVEFFAPPVDFCFWKNPSHLLVFGFVDAGVGCQYHTLAGTKKWDFGIGIGPGIRYSMAPYIEIDLDWGIKLHKIEGGSNSWQRFNFSITASF